MATESQRRIRATFACGVALFALLQAMDRGRAEDFNAAPPNAPAPAFLQWLVDPDDPSSTAFWELLACARRSGCPRRKPGTAGEAASASEAA